MAFAGGIFSRLYNFVTDRNNGVHIMASRVDDEMAGFATGLSNCILKDGTQTLTADIPWGGRKITGLGAATLGTDAMNRDTGDLRWLKAASETRDVVTTGSFSGLNATFTGTLGVTGVATLHNTSVIGTLGVTAATTLAALSATTITASSTLGVTGASTLAAATFSGLGTFNAGLATTSLTASTTLGVTGLSTLGSLSVTGTSSHTGNATFSGTLGVTGLSTLGSLTVTGATSLATLTTSGNATIGGAIGVTNNGGFGSITCSGTSLFSGAATFNGTATFNSTAAINKLGVGPSPSGSGRLEMKQATDGVLTAAEGITLVQSGNANLWQMIIDTSASSRLYFGFNFGSKAYIDPATGTFNAISDRTLKDGIEYLSGSSWDAVKAWKPARFHMKADAEQRTRLGFIAQDMAPVTPEAVNAPTATDSQAAGGIYTMEQGNALVAQLTHALQEAMARIEALEARS